MNNNIVTYSDWDTSDWLIFRIKGSSRDGETLHIARRGYPTIELSYWQAINFELGLIVPIQGYEPMTEDSSYLHSIIAEFLSSVDDDYGCINCRSSKLAKVIAPCDECKVIVDGVSYKMVGEESLTMLVPPNLGIGAFDTISFTYCLECGQIQWRFPISDDQFDEAFRVDD